VRPELSVDIRLSWWLKESAAPSDYEISDSRLAVAF
jgi:hypothetical protein